MSSEIDSALVDVVDDGDEDDVLDEELDDDDDVTELESVDEDPPSEQAARLKLATAVTPIMAQRVKPEI